MKPLTFFLLVGLQLILAVPPIGGAELEEIVLWPEGVPEPRVPAEPAETVEKKADGIARRSNVSNPRLVVYDIPRTEPAKLRSAVLVVPGGGFGILADEHEGSDACRWLNEQGFVSFLVLHRVPTGKMPVPNAAPVQDIQKAVQEVRRRAAEFQIDPAKIAVLGFSAGGQATLVAATNPPTFPTADPAVSPRPDAVLLLYAWKIGGDGNVGVRPDVTIDATTPPMFIAQCGDDRASVPQGAASLYLKLVEATVPAEIHIYEKGGHGFGLKAGNMLPGQLDWKARGIDWLRGRGW
ncbi:alpha/beta hydrolase [bacterium]|nr:alpha/beta hydrolase [bacterium]